MKLDRIGPLLVGTLALACAGVAFQYRVWEFGGPGAALFPVIACTIVMLSCVLVLASEHPGPREEAPQGKGLIKRRRLIGYGAAIMAFGLAIQPLGTISSVGLFLAFILIAIERLRIWTAVSVTVAGCIGVWLLFEKLLVVPLPHGFLG